MNNKKQNKDISTIESKKQTKQTTRTEAESWIWRLPDGRWKVGEWVKR